VSLLDKQVVQTHLAVPGAARRDTTRRARPWSASEVATTAAPAIVRCVTVVTSLLDSRSDRCSVKLRCGNGDETGGRAGSTVQVERGPEWLTHT
jgi:hypothetical protein